MESDEFLACEVIGYAKGMTRVRENYIAMFETEIEGKVESMLKIMEVTRMLVGVKGIFRL